MRAENPFDSHLAVADVPDAVVMASVFVTDTLDLSWKAAQAVFEDKASPELALAIFDRIVLRMQEQSSLPDAPQEQA